GATEWHVNADEPDLLDYDTSFKSDYQDTLFDPTTPYRSSDHDAALVGLSLRSSPVHLVAPLPIILWPANGQLRDIDVVALVGHRLASDVRVLGAESSEADSGLGRRDRPGDVVIVDGDLELRAETFSRWGRTYTISTAVHHGGQTVIVEGVEVYVPP